MTGDGGRGWRRKERRTKRSGVEKMNETDAISVQLASSVAIPFSVPLTVTGMRSSTP